MRRWVPFLAMGLILAMALPAFAQEEIRMVTYGEQYAAHRAIEEAFNASHPGYKLVIETYPFVEYISKLTTMILAGSPPDVFQAWAQYKPAWVEQGILMELGEYWENSDIARNAELYPFVMEAAMYNGKIYGVPHDFNPQVWVLNLDEFDRAGIVYPDDNWTVDDMISNAMKMTDESRNIFGVQLAGHWSTSNWQWSVLYNGQGWLSDDRTQVLVNEPENIDMLEMWYDLVHNRRVANQPGADINLQWMGHYAQWQGWTGWAFRLANEAPYNWGLATLPKGPANNHGFAQGHMWAIPSNASNPDKSWMVLEWLLSLEGQEVIVRAENRQPLSNDSDLWSIYFEQLPANKRGEVQDFIMGTIYGKNLIHTMNYFPEWSDVDRIMNNHLNTIFYNHEVPANAMERAATEIRAVMGL